MKKRLRCNAADDAEFLEHYKFLLRELHRATRPGRNSAVHCSDLPLTKWKDGRIGIKDLSGMIIRAHEECGWTLRKSQRRRHGVRWTAGLAGKT